MIDSHAHLTGDEVFPQIDEILLRAKAAGVEAIINICTDIESLKRGLAKGLYNAGSTTPHDVHLFGESHFGVFQEAAEQKQLVAVGETGLDYYYWKETKELQAHFFRKYITLAKRCNLPLIIHCRDAFSDLFSILDEERPLVPVVIHCFTGTEEEANEAIKRGFMVSFSGIVTYKKSELLREAAKIVPSHQLLIETDTPYLAPQSHRGKPNEPAFIRETAETLAVVRGCSVETLIHETAENARKIFF